MGVVGSLPSPPPPPPRSPSPALNDTTNTSQDESVSSSDDCSYCIMDDEIKPDRNSILNSNININKKSNSRRRCRQASPVTVVYGPINIKVRQSIAPTLATGRRSKFAELDGEAASKREIRRRRNREAARRLKEKRTNIEQELQKEINALESKEQELLLAIKDLQSYKESLEAQHQQIASIQEKLARTTSSAFKQIERDRRRVFQSMPIHHDHVLIKKEPSAPSPQWQLHFSI